MAHQLLQPQARKEAQQDIEGEENWSGVVWTARQYNEQGLLRALGVQSRRASAALRVV